MNSAIISMLILGGAGLVAALILYFVANKFAVHEDERIAKVEALLPGANCGACGRKGCHDFAVACCQAESLDGLLCPGAGAKGMAAIAELLGMKAAEATPRKAFLKCNGAKCNRLVTRELSAVKSCRLAKTLAIPENYCSWGCLGCGDCVAACRFGALTMDEETGLPKVDLALCTGCEACAKACPQKIITMREEADPIVWVACSNQAKGAAARKMCQVACIACGKCVRVCPAKAITLEGNVAVIDGSLCIGCGKCAEGCPTHAISYVGTLKPVETEKEETK